MGLINVGYNMFGLNGDISGDITFGDIIKCGLNGDIISVNFQWCVNYQQQFFKGSYF